MCVSNAVEGNRSSTVRRSFGSVSREAVPNADPGVDALTMQCARWRVAPEQYLQDGNESSSARTSTRGSLGLPLGGRCAIIKTRRLVAAIARQTPMSGGLPNTKLDIRASACVCTDWRNRQGVFSLVFTRPTTWRQAGCGVHLVVQNGDNNEVKAFLHRPGQRGRGRNSGIARVWRRR
ncbi:hypothetical protein GGR25_001063 [Kaistia hirudinis]|uniref:Uncharacterized protein n=1 Tax=Kaistia hirudinis TaxID=1293440 RepID=A0A840ALD2_9HYPH|nr:hypothetical protein [Kaistia hirudinis]